MNRPLRFADLNYEAHTGSDPDAIIRLHEQANAYTTVLAETMEVMLVKHLQISGNSEYNKRRFYFFKRKNHFFSIPFHTHRFLQRQKPDVILIPGFIFPLQVIALRLKLGKDKLILLQHQAEHPFRHPVKRWLQRMACRMADGFIFTSNANAEPWLKEGMIKHPGCCFEIHPASTRFQKKDKQTCREKTGMEGLHNFLWVGRLDPNKDPLTVLQAFREFAETHSGSKLYMIYQTDTLLPQIKTFLYENPELKNIVRLVGKKPNHELEDWYNAADFYINASHHEGGSFALVEAMACGCIPVVSRIPSSMKTIKQGECGLSFTAGNKDELITTLREAVSLNKTSFIENITAHFAAELSTERIAGKIKEAIQILQSKKLHQ